MAQFSTRGKCFKNCTVGKASIFFQERVQLKTHTPPPQDLPHLPPPKKACCLFLIASILYTVHQPNPHPTTPKSTELKPYHRHDKFGAPWREYHWNSPRHWCQWWFEKIAPGIQSKPRFLTGNKPSLPSDPKTQSGPDAQNLMMMRKSFWWTRKQVVYGHVATLESTVLFKKNLSLMLNC